MVDTDPIDPDDVSDDHLYVCEYKGQKTVTIGHDLDLWNEGLSESLLARKDLGRVVHSWVVTEAGMRERRTDYVTDDGQLVLVPAAASQLGDTIIVEDVTPTVEVPSRLFEHSHITTAAASVDPRETDLTANELDHLAANAYRIVERVNDGIEPVLESRYESWREDAFPYPEGRDFAYDVPLEPAWKREVIAERTDLSGAQVSHLATVGYPASMRVRVHVDYPDSLDEGRE